MLIMEFMSRVRQGCYFTSENSNIKILPHLWNKLVNIQRQTIEYPLLIHWMKVISSLIDFYIVKLSKVLFSRSENNNWLLYNSACSVATCSKTKEMSLLETEYSLFFTYFPRERERIFTNFTHETEILCHYRNKIKKRWISSIYRPSRYAMGLGQQEFIDTKCLWMQHCPKNHLHFVFIRLNCIFIRSYVCTYFKMIRNYKTFDKKGRKYLLIVLPALRQLHLNLNVR